jgi:hypothetical protein
LPSGGITGGAVQAPVGATYNVGFNTLAGLTTSVFFKHDDVSTFPTTSGPSGLVGFNGSSNSPLLYGNPETYFWAEFYNDTRVGIFNGGDFPSGFNLVGTIVPPDFGNWLKITLSESYLGDNRFELSAMLENYGMTGMEPPTLLIAGSLTVTNSTAAADPSVFPGFYGYYNVTAFDNFEVVPEPSAIHLIALGGLFLGFLRITRPLFNYLSKVVPK